MVLVSSQVAGAATQRAHRSRITPDARDTPLGPRRSSTLLAAAPPDKRDSVSAFTAPIRSLLGPRRLSVRPQQAGYSHGAPAVKKKFVNCSTSGFPLVRRPG